MFVGVGEGERKGERKGRKEERTKGGRKEKDRKPSMVAAENKRSHPTKNRKEQRGNIESTGKQGLKWVAFSKAAPEGYGGSRARGLIRAVATSLHQSQSNVGSKPRLQPTPQLTAMLDP